MEHTRVTLWGFFEQYCSAERKVARNIHLIMEERQTMMALEKVGLSCTVISKKVQLPSMYWSIGPSIHLLPLIRIMGSQSQRQQPRQGCPNCPSPQLNFLQFCQWNLKMLSERHSSPRASWVFFPVGQAHYTSPGRHPGAIRKRWLGHLNRPLSV